MAITQRFATENYVSVAVEENENKFIKTINGAVPDENGNVEIEAGSVSDEHINALIDTAIEKIPKGAELPTVTADNNGAFLRVVDGAWAVATIPSAEGVNF